MYKKRERKRSYFFEVLGNLKQLVLQLFFVLRFVISFIFHSFPLSTAEMRVTAPDPKLSKFSEL